MLLLRQIQLSEKKKRTQKEERKRDSPAYHFISLHLSCLSSFDNLMLWLSFKCIFKHYLYIHINV